jgi:hypothetical protein
LNYRDVKHGCSEKIVVPKDRMLCCLPSPLLPFMSGCGSTRPRLHYILQQNKTGINSVFGLYYLLQQHKTVKNSVLRILNSTNSKRFCWILNQNLNKIFVKYRNLENKHWSERREFGSTYCLSIKIYFQNYRSNSHGINLIGTTCIH